MKYSVKQGGLTALATLLLFTVFAICTVFTLLAGADIYGKLAQRDRISYENRTLYQYLTTRVRQGDCPGMIFVADFDDNSPKAKGNTLFFCETIGSRQFFTRICCHDGTVRELFCESGLDLLPSDGEALLEAQDLHFALVGNRLTVTILSKDGREETLIIYLRSGKEVSQ